MDIRLKAPAGLLDWAKVYRLYIASFPAAERKPFPIIRRMQREGVTDVLQVLYNGRTVGFAATINGPGLVMLDYFAMDKRCRGQGMGTAALRLLLERYAGADFLWRSTSPFPPGPIGRPASGGSAFIAPAAWNRWE